MSPERDVYKRETDRLIGEMRSDIAHIKDYAEKTSTAIDILIKDNENNKSAIMWLRRGLAGIATILTTMSLIAIPLIIQQFRHMQDLILKLGGP